MFCVCEVVGVVYFDSLGSLCILFGMLDCVKRLLLVSIYTGSPWKIMDLSIGFLTFCNENVLKKNSYCPFQLFVGD